MFWNILQQNFSCDLFPQLDNPHHGLSCLNKCHYETTVISAVVFSLFSIVNFYLMHNVWATCLSFLIAGRSSPSQVFLGKCILKICSKFSVEHPCRIAISIKLQSKSRTSAWVFSCKFAAYFQNTFFLEHLRRAASVLELIFHQQITLHYH